MASAIARRIEASRARRAAQSTTGGSAIADRIARSRARREGRGEEEEEEEGFLSRLYYGEEEGEGGAMGLEEIPGQFWDVVTSPIEMGVKPLVSLGSGIAKIAVDSDEDEDTRLARMAGTQLVESISDLPEAIRRGHPTEGLMNLASVVSLPFTGGGSLAGMVGKVPKLGALAKVGEGLSRVARTKGIRVAEAVADPMSALIGKGAGAAWRRRPKGAPKGEGAPKGAKERIKTYREEMLKPGRTVRQSIVEYMQGFLTNLGQHQVTKLYDFLQEGAERNYKIIREAADSPEAALALVVDRVGEVVKGTKEAAQGRFGRSRVEFRKSGAGDVDLPTELRNPDTTLPFEINRVLQTGEEGRGFGAQLVVHITKPVRDKQGNITGHRRTGDVFAVNEDTQRLLARELRDATYEYDIDWSQGGVESDIMPAKRRRVRNYIINDLLGSKPGSRKPRDINSVLVKDKHMTDEMAAKGPDAAIDEVMANRLHDMTTTAIEERLRRVDRGVDAEKFRQMRDDYRAHKQAMAQLREDFGSKVGEPVVTERITGGLEKALASPEKTQALIELIGQDDVMRIIGIESSPEFGGGLVVKSDVSKNLSSLGNVVKGPFVTLLAPAAAGGYVIAGGIGAFLGPLAAIPLLSFYSPRMMLPLSKRLAESPRFMKAVGRGKAQKEAQRQVSGIMRILRTARGKIGASELQNLAQSGVTFGQLMERLQEEEQR